jgi:hypothetical protein
MTTIPANPITMPTRGLIMPIRAAKTDAERTAANTAARAADGPTLWTVPSEFSAIVVRCTPRPRRRGKRC